MAVVAASAAHAATTPLDSSTSINLLTGSNRSVLDPVADGQATTKTQPNATNAAVPSFSPSLGVLTGVSGSLNVNPGRRLAVTGSEGSGSVSVSLTMPGVSVSGLLASATAGSPPVSTWAALAFGTTSNLDAYVTALGSSGVAPMAPAVLSANRSGAAGEGTLASIVNAQGGSASLTGTVNTQYSYLQHASASWNGTAYSDGITVRGVSQAGTPFTVFALPGTLGAAETTAMDFVSLACSGSAAACNAFNLNFDSFTGLQAGSSINGSVQLKPGVVTSSPLRAIYTFTFADTAGVGALNTHVTSELRLVAFTEVTSPVPEPPAWLLLAAGAGWLVRHRRRPQVWHR